jgi:vacuolar-type H+-ATPase subunit I/STV1
MGLAGAKSNPMNNLIVIARWIGVIPSVIFGCALTFIFFKFSLGFLADDNSFYSIYIVPLVSYTLSSVVAIFSGAMMAPSHQRTVAIILNILFAVIITISIVMYLRNTEYWNVTISFFAFAGNLVGYFYVNDVVKNKK